MNQHPEDHPPPPGPGLRLAGDVAGELAALQRQLDEANAYIADLEADRARVRAWMQAEFTAARRGSLRSGDEARHSWWYGRLEVLEALDPLINPPA